MRPGTYPYRSVPIRRREAHHLADGRLLRATVAWRHLCVSCAASLRVVVVAGWWGGAASVQRGAERWWRWRWNFRAQAGAVRVKYVQARFGTKETSVRKGCVRVDRSSWTSDASARTAGYQRGSRRPHARHSTRKVAQALGPLTLDHAQADSPLSSFLPTLFVFFVGSFLSSSALDLRFPAIFSGLRGRLGAGWRRQQRYIVGDQPACREPELARPKVIQTIAMPGANKQLRCGAGASVAMPKGLSVLQ